MIDCTNSNLIQSIVYAEDRDVAILQAVLALKRIHNVVQATSIPAMNVEANELAVKILRLLEDERFTKQGATA